MDHDVIVGFRMNDRMLCKHCYTEQPKEAGSGYAFYGVDVEVDATCSQCEGCYLTADLKVSKLKSLRAIEGQSTKYFEHSADLAQTALNEAKRVHEQDIRLIAVALSAAAEEQDWCSAYEVQVQTVAATLSPSVRELFTAAATRTHEYTVTVPVTYALTLTVQAASAAKAVEEAEHLTRSQWAKDMSGFETMSEHVDWDSATVED